MPVNISGTNGITNATWTTATRPSAPSTGQMGYNTTIGAMEFYNGSAWVQGGGFTTQSVQTTGFTAVAGNIYPCNTTSAAFTVTLPASPTAGNQIQIIDYAGTFATNNITLGRNGSNITGVASNYILNVNRESVILTYIDSTQGWVVSSAAYTTSPIATPIYTASYLVIAGGGGGGTQNGGGGGAGGLLASSTNLTIGTVYTITVGAGASAVSGGAVRGNSGNNSVVSGTGLSLTAIGGGGGGTQNGTNSGISGGSGGGGAYSSGAGGSGTSGQGNTGGTGSSGNGAGAGGGGAGAAGSNASNSSDAGGNGGSGAASSITGSSVTYAGGGGGGSSTNPKGTGGSGGGGNGAQDGTAPIAGTANTGGGGGGGCVNGPFASQAAAGGSGVVILSVPTANYSGTTTGSPTVTTSGSNTILTFTASGSYTA